jgi:hypothetical protein
MVGSRWQSLAVVGSRWQSLAVVGSRWQSLAVVGGCWQWFEETTANGALAPFSQCKPPQTLAPACITVRSTAGKAASLPYLLNAVISSSSLSAICCTSACVGGSLTAMPSVFTALLLLLVVAMASVSCTSET